MTTQVNTIVDVQEVAQGEEMVDGAAVIEVTFKHQDVKEESAKHQDVKEGSTKHQDVKEESTKHQDVNEESAKHQDGKEAAKKQDQPTENALSNFRLELMKLMGGDGKFQVFITVYLSLLVSSAMESGILQQIMVTLSPDHWCSIPSEIGDSHNITIKDWNIPKILGPDGSEKYDRCHIYKDVNKSDSVVNTRAIVPCTNGWTYNFTTYHQTMTTENNWVCDDAWKEYFVISMFWAGSIFGPTFIGYITDKFGRRPAIILSYSLAGIAAVLTTVMPDFASISVARFLAGFPYWSLPILPYLWAMEFVSASKRSLVTFVWTICFSLSWVIFPWLAYLLRDWRMFVLLTSTPVFLVVIFNSILPESISWLTVKGCKKRISRTATQVSIINRQNTSLELQAACDKYFASLQNVKEDPGLKSLITHPRLRKNFILLIVLMKISTVAFATLPHASSALSEDNPFLSFSVASAFDCLGPLLQWFLLDHLGRRCYLSGCFLLCALSGFAASAVPTDYTMVFTSLLISSRLFGVQSFCVVCLVMTEILPTELRGRGISTIQTFGAITSVAAPYIIYLKMYHRALPLLVISGLATIGAVATMFLPETTNKLLPQTVEDGKNFGEGQSFWYIPYFHKQKKTKHSDG